MQNQTYRNTFVPVRNTSVPLIDVGVHNCVTWWMTIIVALAQKPYRQSSVIL